MEGQLTFGTIDWLVIVIYFIIVFIVAAWATLKERAGEETSADYFLAGRNVGWFVVGASLFASNIGAEHLVGLAGTGAASGVAVGQFEVQASLIVLLLGWVFVPFYVKSGVFTMPEFLERRYSKGARWYLAIISIVGYVLTKISVTIFAGAIVFEAVGVPFWTGAVVVVVITGIYTVFGGLRAVLYTDLMQTFVLLGGAGLVTVVGLMEVGGWSALRETVGPGFFNMWKPITHPQFPWTGILFGAPIVGVWYWCTDQFIVQRTLSAKGIDDARRGTIFAGYLKLLPLFIFVLPGVIAYALVQQGVIRLPEPDQALPVLVQALLPVGLRGIVVAGLLAALMSSLSSVFNSCSTLVTWDVYRELRPEASGRQLVWVGRLATALLTVLGLLWIPLLQVISGQLYTYLQSVQSYIAPPIAAVFLLGIFWKRVNAKGAMASLLTGFALGMARLVLELMNGADKTGLPEGSLWALVAEINFLHIAIFLFIICVAVLVGVSLMTAPPSRRKLAGLTFATAEEPVAGRADEPMPPAPAAAEPAEAGTLVAEPEPDIHTEAGWRRRDVVLTIVLVACVALIWLYFSG